MRSLKHYIREVEADKSSQLANNIVSEPSKHAVSADALANWQRDIATDERGFKGNSSAGNELLRDKSRKLHKQRVLNKQREVQQQKQRQQAEISGYEQAGKDEYSDYMNKVEKQVASMADKGSSKLIQQRNAISVMAKRKLK